MPGNRPDGYSRDINYIQNPSYTVSQNINLAMLDVADNRLHGYSRDINYIQNPSYTVSQNLGLATFDMYT